MSAPFIVQREALHQVFAQALGSPAAELGAAWGANTVAHGQDGVEVVIDHPVVFAIGGNSPSAKIALRCLAMFCLLV